MTKLLYYPNPFLHIVTKKVTEFDQSLYNLLDSMTTTMLKHNGLGLSANQIGVDARIFIFKSQSGSIYEVINPEIISVDGYEMMDEGCLSIPGVYTSIGRPSMVKLTYTTRNNTSCTGLFVGIDARAILHEFDHISGIMYLDRINRKDRKKIISKLKKWYYE